MVSVNIVMKIHEQYLTETNEVPQDTRKELVNKYILR